MRRHPYASAMLAKEGSDALAPLLNGLQLVRFGPDGLITRVTGMVRPLTGLTHTASSAPGS